MDTADQALYHCVGICLPDEDEAYCIGCGRPWTTEAPAVPPSPTFEEPDQRTSYSKLPPT
ncbi:MAG: DUF1289 domain-containing protein [Rhodocyclaceae bacterium]|nr:DUF1289 domain-containing protein [Rhodocyclaceae bacterium]MDZ4215970.1 hypothetical protein [Rhodocyclaceae bacterium]